ncbi:MAG: putative toxin-antitoxin system toxin component, PIN family [Gammaproteobacteria bacterium]
MAGLLWQGPPQEILLRAMEGKVMLATSPALLSELEGILHRSKFARQIAKQPLSIQALLLRYAELARVVMPAAIPPVILNDPDDDQVLACALAAKAQLIISGDSDLLSLGAYQGIRIAGPAAALPKMR